MNVLAFYREDGLQDLRIILYRPLDLDHLIPPAYLVPLQPLRGEYLENVYGVTDLRKMDPELHLCSPGSFWPVEASPSLGEASIKDVVIFSSLPTIGLLPIAGQETPR